MSIKKLQVSRALTDFRKLWAGQSFNLLGDQMLTIALPLLALSVTAATVSQAALLRFALFLPFLLFGLPAGAIVDRLPRRLTMIACDMLQAFIFILITVLAMTQHLGFYTLLILVGIAGTAVVFFQVAYTSYLPELFSEKQALQRGNARLFLSESLARTIGPVLAGPIIVTFGVIAAIAVNAGTFIISVLSLFSIKRRYVPRVVNKKSAGWLRRDIADGLKFIIGHPILEPVISCGVVYVLFLSMIESSLVLYCHNILKLGPVGIGIVLGAATLGFPLGNLLSSRLVARVGAPAALVLGAIIAVTGLTLIPIAGAFGSVVGLILASIIHGTGEGIFGPTALTLRQTETPSELLGRINSVQRFLIWGAIPVGSLLSAFIIRHWGLQNILWVGGCGTILCLVPLLRRGILSGLFSARIAKINVDLV